MGEGGNCLCSPHSHWCAAQKWICPIGKIGFFNRNFQARKRAGVTHRSKKQFALITPATKTRVDLGLALKGDEPAGRLEKGDAMCSHRVRLESVEAFDPQVQGWMTEAYSRAG